MGRNISSSKQDKGLNINTRSFLTAILVIFVLMILTYVLAMTIPGGYYTRTIDSNGHQVIDTTIPFQYRSGGIPFWKWLLSPVLVLGAEGNGTLIAVIAFLLVIGGIFNSLDKCGVMKYMLDRIVDKYGIARYQLLAVITLFFMMLGAFIGSYEECVPLVPIVTALTIRLGFDALTGLCISILAASCGFASGVCNPFTVGVAQNMVGLPMFSGIWFRGLGFCCIYLLLLGFIVLRAKKIDTISTVSVGKDIFYIDKKMDRSLRLFGSILGLGILLVLSSSIITVLQDYTMIIVAAMFLIAGVTSVLASGMSFKNLVSTFGMGIVTILPAVLMILMASSIKYILIESNVLDTILHGMVSVAETLPKWFVILFIYFVVLVLNFFIATGSAKAIMLMPLIAPIAQIFQIPLQLCIVAYAFGDGFSNAFYPTNPVLLISLGLADVSYGKWAACTWKFQVLNLFLTSMLLLLGLAIGYC